MVVEVEVEPRDGLEKLRRALAALPERQRKMGELMDRLGVRGVVAIHRTMMMGGRQLIVPPFSGAWPPWSERYAATLPGGAKMLRRTQMLFGSITHVYDQTSVAMGTNLIYGRTHQWGDAARNIPQRAFVGLAQDDIEAMEKMIMQWSEEVVSRG